MFEVALTLLALLVIEIVSMGEPIINNIEIEKDEDQVSFIVSADGTGNDYLWSRNGILVNNGDEGATVELTPPTLRVSDIEDGDIVKVEVTNMNVHGDVGRDVAWAFVITPSPTTATTSTEGSSSVNTLLPVATGCVGSVGSSSSGTPKMLEISLIVICSFLGIVFLVLFSVLIIVIRHYNRSKANDSENNDIINIKIGGSSVKIYKSRMNDISDFFEKIETIMGMMMTELDNSESGINEHVKTEARKLKRILVNWEAPPPTPPAQEDRTVVDSRVRCDGNNVQLTNVIEKGSTPPPEYTPNDENIQNNGSICDTSVGTNNNTSAAQESMPDIFALLMPTLAKKIDESR